MLVSSARKDTFKSLCLFLQQISCRFATCHRSLCNLKSENHPNLLSSCTANYFGTIPLLIKFLAFIRWIVFVIATAHSMNFMQPRSDFISRYLFAFGCDLLRASASASSTLLLPTLRCAAPQRCAEQELELPGSSCESPMTDEDCPIMLEDGCEDMSDYVDAVVCTGVEPEPSPTSPDEIVQSNPGLQPQSSATALTVNQTQTNTCVLFAADVGHCLHTPSQEQRHLEQDLPQLGQSVAEFAAEESTAVVAFPSFPSFSGAPSPSMNYRAPCNLATLADVALNQIGLQML